MSRLACRDVENEQPATHVRHPNKIFKSMGRHDKQGGGVGGQEGMGSTAEEFLITESEERMI